MKGLERTDLPADRELYCCGLCCRVTASPKKEPRGRGKQTPRGVTQRELDQKDEVSQARWLMPVITRKEDPEFKVRLGCTGTWGVI